MAKPIRPSEVESSEVLAIPDFVLEAFNELITKGYRSGRSTVSQPEVVKLIKQKMVQANATTNFDSRWLDVEGVYQKAGWDVEYDSPGWNESGESTYKFIKSGRK